MIFFRCGWMQQHKISTVLVLRLDLWLLSPHTTSSITTLWWTRGPSASPIVSRHFWPAPLSSPLWATLHMKLAKILMMWSVKVNIYSYWKSFYLASKKKMVGGRVGKRGIESLSSFGTNSCLYVILELVKLYFKKFLNGMNGVHRSRSGVHGVSTSISQDAVCQCMGGGVLQYAAGAWSRFTICHSWSKSKNELGR